MIEGSVKNIKIKLPNGANIIAKERNIRNNIQSIKFIFIFAFLFCVYFDDLLTQMSWVDFKIQMLLHIQKPILVFIFFLFIVVFWVGSK